MRRSRISAIFFTGSIICLAINIIIIPDLEGELKLFIFPSAILIVLIILALIMALKEINIRGAYPGGNIGNARTPGYIFFFMSTLILIPYL